MVNQAKNSRSISEDEAALELHRLQEAAKLAAIYHNIKEKFQKRTDLSHVAHASLHGAQFVRDRMWFQIYLAIKSDRERFRL